MLETKVAYMAFRFNVAVELTRIEPPDLIEARITGTPSGIIGRLTATSTTRLLQQGDETLIEYTSSSVLTGKLGSIGQPVLRAKAKDMERAVHHANPRRVYTAGDHGQHPMTTFELEAPTSLRSAVDLLDPHDPSVRVIAGGTALMLMMKAGVFRPSRLISLRAIEQEFSTFSSKPDGSFRIGAMATLSALEHAPDLIEFAPVLRQTLHTLSNVRVRNVATIGGHLAHADPHMDLAPVLIALGAEVVVTGRKGDRRIPVQDLYAGYYETVLARDELISEVIIPPQQQRRATYIKCSTRAAHDWPALGVAVSLDVADNVGRAPRIVISAVNERPIRVEASEAILNGRQLEPSTLRSAAEAAADKIETII